MDFYSKSRNLNRFLAALNTGHAREQLKHLNFTFESHRNFESYSLFRGCVRISRCSRQVDNRGVSLYGSSSYKACIVHDTESGSCLHGRINVMCLANGPSVCRLSQPHKVEKG